MNYLLQFLVIIGLALGFIPGAQAHDGMSAEPQICAGFVVLPNGYAVLSAVPVGMAHSMPAMQHAHATSETAKSDHHPASAASHEHAMAHHEQAAHTMEHQTHKPGTSEKTSTEALMGYHHGEDVVPRQGMTCVPIGTPENTAWLSVSPEANIVVLAKSLKGSLAHNSRANEALALEIVLDGKVVEQAQVRLLARMPQHDERMPGGHGPANDPDVQGLEAKYDTAHERYMVPTVDFSMSGPWLFEVQINQDNTMHKAYFAAEVGEE